jgi:putative flavoprotein involved in K+ transport
LWCNRCHVPLSDWHSRVAYTQQTLTRLIALAGVGTAGLSARRARQGARVHAGKGTPLVRVRPGDVAEAGVERAQRVVGQVDGRPQLEDGRVLDVANVIWCTGYRPDYSWIALRSFLATSNPLISAAPSSISPACMSLGSRSCSG